MLPAIPALSHPPRPDGPGTRWHRCLACGRRFPYRHDGPYRPDQLRPVDFVCRRCFPAWFAAWEAAHGWGPPQPAAAAAPPPGWTILRGGAPQ